MAGSIVYVSFPHFTRKRQSIIPMMCCRLLEALLTLSGTGSCFPRSGRALEHNARFEDGSQTKILTSQTNAPDLNTLPAVLPPHQPAAAAALQDYPSAQYTALSAPASLAAFPLGAATIRTHGLSTTQKQSLLTQEPPRVARSS